MADRSPIPLTLEAEWRTYHVAMREWQHQMTEHFGGMPPPEETRPYMAWRPPPVPPVRGRPGSFDASLATTPSIATPETAGSTPLGGPTPHDSPRVVRHNAQHRRHHCTDSTAGSQAMPPPHTWPRTSSTTHLTSPTSASASSSRASPASNQTRSSPGTSTRVSPASSGPGRGRRGCCRGDDDVDGSAHIFATNNDRAGQETSVGRSYYTVDEAGGIVTDGTGRGALRYLLKLVIVHVRNVYAPWTYRDGVIEQIISAFNTRYPMLEHLAVSSVWLRRMTLSHSSNHRSGYTRDAWAVVEQEGAGLPP
jgi:hypothetical protein